VLVRTPSFFQARMTPDVFVRHYTAVADAAPVPVLLYNVPAVTGVNLTPDAVGRLARHPNIIGVKETGSDTAQLAAFVAAAPGTFAVIAGSAPTFYPSLCVGATGGILAVSCVLPALCVELHEHFRAGRHGEARDLQRRLTPLAKLVTTGLGVAGLKKAMDLAGFTGGAPRAPLVPLTTEATAQVRDALALFRPVESM
jgi:4-hydroxy-2-oxoglutarate aldolase